VLSVQIFSGEVIVNIAQRLEHDLIHHLTEMSVELGQFTTVKRTIQRREVLFAVDFDVGTRFNEERVQVSSLRDNFVQVQVKHGVIELTDDRQTLQRGHKISELVVMTPRGVL